MWAFWGTEALFSFKESKSTSQVRLNKCNFFLFTDRFLLFPLADYNSMCSFQLKRKLFTIWVRYCQWRRFRKSQYGKADYHFRERALPRFVSMLVYSNRNKKMLLVTKLWMKGVGNCYLNALFLITRYFCRMMIFVDLMHSNKENNIAAEKFRRWVIYRTNEYYTFPFLLVIHVCL